MQQHSYLTQQGKHAEPTPRTNVLLLHFTNNSYSLTIIRQMFGCDSGVIHIIYSAFTFFNIYHLHGIHNGFYDGPKYYTRCGLRMVFHPITMVHSLITQSLSHEGLLCLPVDVASRDMERVAFLQQYTLCSIWIPYLVIWVSNRHFH